MTAPCARCEGDRGEGRWCATCGLDSAPGAATLPTPDAIGAGKRELEWFEDRPGHLRAQEARDAEADRERSRGQLAIRATRRPATFDAYRDLDWRARLARGWLLIVVALSAASAALEIVHLGALAGVTGDDYALSPEVTESNGRLAVVYIATFCAYLLCAGFFIAWTWRSHKNARALGAESLRHGSGWAIGGWFVPILAFWRPKQVVNDIWRASEPGGPPVLRQSDWLPIALPGLLTAWWTFFILSAVLERLSGRVTAGSFTLDADRNGTILGLAASLCTIAAGVLAFQVVRRITDRQRERAAELAKLPPFGSAAPAPQAPLPAPAA